MRLQQQSCYRISVSETRNPSLLHMGLASVNEVPLGELVKHLLSNILIHLACSDLGLHSKISVKFHLSAGRDYFPQPGDDVPVKPETPHIQYRRWLRDSPVLRSALLEVQRQPSLDKAYARLKEVRLGADAMAF